MTRAHNLGKMVVAANEVAQAIANAQRKHKLDTGDVASCVAGILITLCTRAGQDPLAFMQLAVAEAARAKP